MLTEMLRKAMSSRYRLNVSKLLLLLFRNDGPIVPLEDSRVVKNDKLQSTTLPASPERWKKVALDWLRSV